MKKLFAIAILATIFWGTSCQQQQPAKQAPEPTSESNTTIEDILSRRSIRAYKEQAVPRDLLDQIVECGIWAPNGMNAQQWEVRIVDSKEWLDNITAAYKESVKGTPTERMVEQPEFKNMFRNAPAVIFVAHKPGHCTQVDCGLMAGNIVLSAKDDIVLRVSDFPEVQNYAGHELVVTDGHTLLGADDKAGVAEIMTAVQYMMEHPEFKHGEIRIGFTPDEEIGRGVVKFDVKKFDADYAYTMDGGEVGELEFENFNAASAAVHIQGRNVHPGYAKGKMLNAIHIGQEFNELLPADQRPERTEGYEGFFHLISFKGSVEESDFTYIIRDHDRAKFEQKKQVIQQCADFINARYGEGTVTLTVKDQYYNMREQVEPHYHIVEKAVKAMEMAGVKARIQPIRGGTDGANLSFKGLPCPNIFAGGQNFHGKMEWIPVESMEKATQVILTGHAVMLLKQRVQ